ncbi:hypothetical protein [Sporomusa acidovorans]|uniref:Uncharacterized protein n=1 Tax=Sporomusa acidovorans (strain ATCC 49682 / DSM 3132 / Mol) TaxID=1123286 RepID=A0ABZ3J6W7_SPOA4|nr:hypothetical protein [Sporomusa acidovorans]OZC23837.1 hypothetical protein SPACI_04620 [Sporomusa acidovorans DSM 3132]SDF81178.1 hypothetical protein SAMN04488499_10883 [Sporomusa acidovorans]
MAIVSFDEMEYQSGEAVVWKTEVEGKVAKIWFKLDDGRIIRETYRTGYPDEKKRLKEVAEVFFGDDVSGRVDLDKMVGQVCYVELEERPWGNQTWTGVRAVSVVESEPEYAGYDEYEPDYEPEHEQPLQSGGMSENTAVRQRKIAKKQNPVTELSMDNPLPVEMPSERRRRPGRTGDGLGREALLKLRDALKAKQAEQAKEQEQLFEGD